MVIGQKWFLVFLGARKVGEGLMSQTGKLKVWDICEKWSGVIRINI